MPSCVTRHEAIILSLDYVRIFFSDFSYSLLSDMYSHSTCSSVTVNQITPMPTFRVFVAGM